MCLLIDKTVGRIFDSGVGNRSSRSAIVRLDWESFGDLPNEEDKEEKVHILMAAGIR